MEAFEFKAETVERGDEHIPGRGNGNQAERKQNLRGAAVVHRSFLSDTQTYLISFCDAVFRRNNADRLEPLQDVRMLGAFMFGGEDSTKKVKVLSGGERTRLAILKLLLEPVNLLILDEPTNHLDLKTKDVLKQALLDFDGTLIVVSHDRDFLDGLVSKVYEFGHGRVREHLCGIYEFLESKKMENLQELEKKQ